MVNFTFAFINSMLYFLNWSNEILKNALILKSEISCTFKQTLYESQTTLNTNKIEKVRMMINNTKN